MPDLEVFSLAKRDLTDEVLACAELAQDPLFHKIPADRISYYVNTSLRRGMEAALAYRGTPVRELCEREGLRYEITERYGAFHNVSFRAEIDFAKAVPKIVIYASSLRDMRQAYRVAMSILDKDRERVQGQDQERDQELDQELERLIDIHLAHEFYHYLEYKSGQFTNETLEKIEVFRLGTWFAKRSTVVRTSEIAAHAFCKEILGLPFLPNVLDYIFLLQQGTLTESQLYQDIDRWKTMPTSF